MGMTKTKDMFEKLKKVDDIDLRYAVDTLEGMWIKAFGGSMSPSDIEKRLTEWEIYVKVRSQYKEDFKFLVDSVKKVAFING
tara:strand:+ start:642 stop:887 length:246 start_codon:yes stop_codon:yes gene_type:complete